MTIQYASDLHLEFPENKAFVQAKPLQPKGDILLLAGDIVSFAVMDKHQDFFNYISDNFKTTYWLPGNHEYYYSDLAQKQSSFIENIKSNVHLVNNMTVKIEDARIILSTLWSKINLEKQWFIERNVSDFQVIKYNGFRFSIDAFNELHTNCLNFITTELKKSFSGKTIVATHHVPTLQHYPEQYRHSDINEAFAVELFDLIEHSVADYWVYGHHHSNTPDFVIGGTQLCTNQMGYVEHNEHLLFNPEKVLVL